MKAGKSTRHMEEKRRRLRTNFIWITIGLMVALCTIMLFGLKYGGFTSCFISICVMWVLTRVDKGSHEILDLIIEREKHAKQGAEAEEKIGEILDHLDKNRFQVFHDVVIGYGNIDHLVLRRDGAIFMIETKSQDGEITLRGSELLRNGFPLGKDALKQTLGNVMGLNQHITSYTEGRKIWVNGIICFSNAFVKGPAIYKNIQIIPGKWLAEKLEKGKGNPELADWLWEHMATLVTLPKKEPAPGPDALQ